MECSQGLSRDGGLAGGWGEQRPTVRRRQFTRWTRALRQGELAEEQLGCGWAGCVCETPWGGPVSNWMCGSATQKRGPGWR